jgi:hypothetical protein
VGAVAGELTVDADEAVVVVDVGPAESERFADAEAGVGEELEQRPVALGGVREHLGELLAFEDGHLFRCPARLLARFELADRVGGEPAATNGETADLVERYQDDHRGGGGECAFVRE